ncbi:MAG TPA: hypothetical protein VG387_07290 [Rhizomicrobium sp.]|jgi:hypothetical protein|nr:hypothetical protein [Rhizomicrobium sp.]
MSLDEIERAIEKLSPQDQAKLRAKIFNDDWDRQMEADFKAGKFDRLAEKALAEHEAGLSEEF